MDEFNRAAGVAKVSYTSAGRHIFVKSRPTNFVENLTTSGMSAFPLSYESWNYGNYYCSWDVSEFQTYKPALILTKDNSSIVFVLNLSITLDLTLCRDYNIAIRLRYDYDPTILSRAPASIRRDSTRAKNEHVIFSL